MIPEDLDGLLQSSREVHSVPVTEIFAECVQVNDTILDQSSIDSDIGVKIDPSTKFVLYLGHDVGSQRT